MAADYNKPTTSSIHTAVLTELKDNLNAILKMNQAGAGNLPVDAKQWSDANGRFEKWNGTSWEALIALASTTVAGLVQLSNATGSSSQNHAATSKALMDGLALVLKRDGSNGMAGNIDMNNNNITQAGSVGSGTSDQVRQTHDGSNGKVLCNVGDLVIGTDGTNQDVLIQTSASNGTDRTVMKIQADGNIVCFGSVTFNNGAIT